MCMCVDGGRCQVYSLGNTVLMMHAGYVTFICRQKILFLPCMLGWRLQLNDIFLSLVVHPGTLSRAAKCWINNQGSEASLSAKELSQIATWPEKEANSVCEIQWVPHQACCGYEKVSFLPVLTMVNPSRPHPTMWAILYILVSVELDPWHCCP